MNQQSCPECDYPLEPIDNICPNCHYIINPIPTKDPDDRPLNPDQEKPEPINPRWN